jgi:calcium permeable stress-gated cation channel
MTPVNFLQTGLWGLWGQRVDAIEYYQKEIEDLCKQVY